jgi:hypothetical protein
MTDPENALEQARASAAAMRASGAYEPLPESGAKPGELTTANLLEWAMIEPDVGEVRSTRLLGAPITAAKRLLLRLLGQYHAELIAQQTRFNLSVIGRVDQLEQRIEQLERDRGRDTAP